MREDIAEGTSETKEVQPSPPTPEDMARAQLKEFETWWTRIWNSGAAGKVGIVLVLAAYALPFVFDVVAVFLAWFLVWPLASGVTERLAVLGFIFVVLTAIGIQLRNAAYQIVTGLFITRRRRRGRSTRPPQP